MYGTDSHRYTKGNPYVCYKCAYSSWRVGSDWARYHLHLSPTCCLWFSEKYLVLIYPPDYFSHYHLKGIRITDYHSLGIIFDVKLHLATFTHASPLLSCQRSTLVINELADVACPEIAVFLFLLLPCSEVYCYSLRLLAVFRALSFLDPHQTEMYVVHHSGFCMSKLWLPEFDCSHV